MTTNTTMTMRVFLERVAEDYKDTNAEMSEFALGRIKALDKRNESRKSKPSKSQIANEPIKAKIGEILGIATVEKPMLASDIAVACEVSTQKVTALVKQIDGVKSVDVKVKGKGTRKAYYLE